jgi:hypothetical protein
VWRLFSCSLFYLLPNLLFPFSIYCASLSVSSLIHLPPACQNDWGRTGLRASQDTWIRVRWNKQCWVQRP